MPELGHLERRVSIRRARPKGAFITFADSLLCADLGSIFHGMQGEVNLRNGLLVLYSVDNFPVIPTLSVRHLVFVCVGSFELLKIGERCA